MMRPVVSCTNDRERDSPAERSQNVDDRYEPTCELLE